MIAKVLVVFTEYLSMILCLHKVARKRIEINWQSILYFAIYMIFMYVSKYISFVKLVIYVHLFVYTKMKVTDTWKHAIKVYVVTMCVIPMLQLLLYGVISGIVQNASSIYLMVAIIINIMIIIFLIVWKERYLFILMNLVAKFRKIIFFILLIFLCKYSISYYSKYRMLQSYYIDQIVICFLIVALMLILWVNSENEKRHKAEELRTYQLYTETFEDAVAAIRMKQHEFDNHINAIRCMQYTIRDPEKLIEEQNKYCDKILQDNKYNKLLKVKMSPILIGYLYSKFTAASTRNINVEYEIEDINIEIISINDLIEIFGILFDNAVEALTYQDNKEIEVNLLQKDSNFIISVANRSNYKTNTEIEKFFEYGYSTKGNGHGIGLYRVNMLLKKYKAHIQVENISECDKNYLRFKVVFDLRIKGIA